MSFADLLHEATAWPAPSRSTALSLLVAVHCPELLDPRERKGMGLHPLLIPLGREPDGTVLGFLRWPTPDEGSPLPIVRQGAHGLELVARSTDEWLHRELAIRDATEGDAPGPLLEATNREGELYPLGGVAISGLPLKAYVLLKTGATFEFHEKLVEAHLAKGDTQAARITADRACRVATGWARPQAYRALLLQRLGDAEIARDSAVAALTEPVFTLGMPFEPVARLAGWKGDITSASFRSLATNPAKPLLDRAAHVMDAVAVEGSDWDATRGPLAALYTEAGLTDMARVVAG